MQNKIKPQTIEMSNKDEKRFVGIPGTSYRIQLGLINGKWASRLLKGNDIIDSYVYKDEDVGEQGFPNQNMIVGWVLRTIAVPNINPHQIMKTVQDLIRQVNSKMDNKGYKDNEDDDRFPYPYIFKPPKPPDDIAMSPQVQVHSPLREKDPEDEMSCQYCGRKLDKEEQLTHSCKKKPKTT